MDISNAVWNEVDASNTAAAPDGAIEGMMPSGVNNTLRAHQGAIKRFWKRSSVMTTAGTAAAYTVSHTVPPTALADGEVDLIQFHAANAAGATLNVGALGAIPLHYYSAAAWRVVPAALWAADQVLRVAYHGSSAAYRILDLPDRTGEVVTYAGATAPAGTLLCFGQAISRTAYAGLFAAISTAHGVGDGSSTFNLPDLRGRVGAGKDDMGGSGAGNLTGGDTLGAGLGAESVSVLVTGSSSTESASVGVQGGGATVVALQNHTHLAGGYNVSTDIVQPTLVLNYVIRI